jgi:hypothetical protein
MSVRSRVGVACPIPSERAALLEWLTSSGFAPVPMIDGESIGRHLESGGFEVLVVDADLLRSAVTMLRLLGPNRPLIIVGEADDVAAMADARRRDASFLARPLTPDTIGLAVTLALAEGRPARRHRRRPVARIPAMVHELPSYMIDVSYDGIRLEISEQHRATIPPFFRVQVPMFRVGVHVQRVWISTPPTPQPRPSIWCGVILRQNSENATGLWRSLVDHAPASMALTSGPTFNAY